eukprot:11472052-Heterocapsa_arctica.AAC.1
MANRITWWNDGSRGLQAISRMEEQGGGFQVCGATGGKKGAQRRIRPLLEHLSMEQDGSLEN